MRKKRAYILILPSLFTTGNLFCGYYSIFRSFNDEFELACLFIVLAGVFDLLDGRVARLTKSQSAFGVEFDSIADVVSFGVAPSILAYFYLLKDFGRLGFSAGFFFAACGALRLARFNTLVNDEPKSYFLGLPIPSAAITLISFIYLDLEQSFRYREEFFVFLTFILGLLMVSNVRYRSLKDFDLRHKRNFFQLVLLLGVISISIVRPEWGLFLIFFGYVCWGLIQEGLVIVLRKRKKLEIRKEGDRPHDV